MTARVLLIDNYDSFTHNLYQYLGELGAQVQVVRNDELDLAGIVARAPTHIVISPGPGHPGRARDFGVCGEVIRALTELPILGVCLGHQGIALNFGGTIIPAPEVMHGKTDCIEHTTEGLFEGLPQPLEVMRYHSWIVDEATLPAELEVTARNPRGLIMALRHRSRPLWGVQFHPESIGTPHGHGILANFLRVPGGDTATGLASRVELRVPPSKSVTHRALILAARSRTPCVVHHPLLGADGRSTLQGLRGMGARCRAEGSSLYFEPIEAWSAPDRSLDCGNSGTTLRLLTGQAATCDFPVELRGDPSLQARPNAHLIQALGDLGVQVQTAPGGRAPLTVQGPLRPGRVRLPAGTSSQFASALILGAAVGPPGNTHLHLARPVASRPYLGVTLEVAAAFGLQVNVREEEDELIFEVPGAQRPEAREFEVEGDWSSAAFPLVAAALSQRPVSLSGLRRGSSQGDEAVCELLSRFGPRVRWVGDRVELDPQPLVGAGEVDLSATPDLFAALVVLGVCAVGGTRFVNAPQLRDKECDRIAAMAAGLAALGVSTEEHPDGLTVVGAGQLRSAHLDSRGDHRVHMAFALLAAGRPGITVSDPGCEAVSYPGFYVDMARLGLMPPG